MEAAVENFKTFEAAVGGDFLDGQLGAGEEDSGLGELMGKDVPVRSGAEVGLEKFKDLRGADPAMFG